MRELALAVTLLLVGFGGSSCATGTQPKSAGDTAAEAKSAQSSSSGSKTVAATSGIGRNEAIGTSLEPVGAREGASCDAIRDEVVAAFYGPEPKSDHLNPVLYRLRASGNRCPRTYTAGTAEPRQCGDLRVYMADTLWSEPWNTPSPGAGPRSDVVIEVMNGSMACRVSKYEHGAEPSGCHQLHIRQNGPPQALPKPHRENMTHWIEMAGCKT
jgi:hypothetical protein